MGTKIIIIITLIFSIEISVYGFEQKESAGDSTNDNEVLVGIYAGYGLSQKISNAHGKHGSFGGQSIDATVEGIHLEQDLGIGINTKIYFTKNIGLEADLLYSPVRFPEQNVTLQGSTIYQPKSDLKFFTISAGPGYRYRDKGIWQNLNPYVSLALAALIGYASDVNFTSTYGHGGYSEVTGIGFNLHLGMQYHINKLVLLIEYRYEYLSSKVDYFRSFTEGLSFNKSTSYILAGIEYSF